MSLRCLFVVVWVVSETLASAQTPTPTSTPMKFVNPWVSVAQPNIPDQPLAGQALTDQLGRAVFLVSRSRRGPQTAVAS